MNITVQSSIIYVYLGQPLLYNIFAKQGILWYMSKRKAIGLASNLAITIELSMDNQGFRDFNMKFTGDRFES